MLTAPYDITERTRRVLLGAYNTIQQASIYDASLNFASTLEYLDAMQNTLGGSDSIGLVEWHVNHAGTIIWDVYPGGADSDDEEGATQPYAERLRLLAKNRRIGRLLKQINSIESLSLFSALRECATAKENTDWSWDITPSGTVIRSDYETPGGKAKKSEATAQKHWGRSLDVVLKILYLPELEEQIIAGAPRSEDFEVENIRQAIVAHLDGALSRPALERAGLLAVETSARNSEPVEIPQELHQLILDQGKSELTQ